MKSKATKSPGATRAKTKTTKASAKSAKSKGKVVKPSKSKKVSVRKPSPSNDSELLPAVETTTVRSSWSVEPGRPNSFAKLGKNKKKAWRRVDVSDVEVFLEEQRRDERTGASQLIDVKDDDLFVVDTKGSLDANPNKEIKKLNKLVRDSVSKPPPIDPSVVFRQLRNVSKVGPACGVNYVKTPEERMMCAKWRDAALKKLRERAVESIIDRRKSAQLRKGREKTKKIKEFGDKASFYDLWAPEKEKLPEEVGLGDEELVKHILVDTMKKKLPKTPANFHKNPNELPKVEPPHPGMSYNPSVADHCKLLQDATLIELKKKKEALKWKRQTVDMFPTIDKAPTEQDKILELAEGLFEEDEEQAKEEETVEADDGKNEEEEVVYKAPIRAEDRKTRQKRRREHEAKMRAIVAAEAKKLKRKESQVFRAKQICKELEFKEKRIQRKVEYKKRKAEEYQKFATHKLNSVPFEDMEVPLKFVDEITGSLRELKPEGHLAVDRFKSLQKRNIIEPRVKAKAPKRKVKRYMTRENRKLVAELGIKDQNLYKKISWH